MGYTNGGAESGLEAGAGAPSAGASAGKKAEAKFNLFAYLLPGMAGMFLLMLASQGMTDLHRELWRRTFERYHTLRERLLPFVVGKALFTVVIVGLGAAIILGGGQWLFGFRWPRPLELGLLTLGYACFATGLMALSVAMMPDEHRANALNNVLSMVLSMAGGCMFPPEQMPAFMRDQSLPAYADLLVRHDGAGFVVVGGPRGSRPRRNWRRWARSASDWRRSCSSGDSRKGGADAAILAIGHNDLRLFFKSKTSFIWLFLIPTAMVYFLGLANHEPGDPTDRHPPVLIDNKDTNFLSAALLEEMNAEGMWVVAPPTRKRPRANCASPPISRSERCAGKRRGCNSPGAKGPGKRTERCWNCAWCAP